MNIKRSVFFVTTICLLLLICNTNCTADEPVVKLKIVSMEGGETTLSSPISGDWEFALGDFTIKFDIASIKHIERTSDGILELTPVTGSTLNVKKLKYDATIQGTGEWGLTNIAWQQVKSIEFEVNTPPTAISENGQDKTPKTLLWQVISLGGVALEFYDFSWSYSQWQFETKAFKITADIDRVKSIERLDKDNEWRITYLDGKTFDGTAVNPESEKIGTSKWGQAGIVFAKINKIIRIAQEQPTNEEASREKKPIASLTLRSGSTVDVLSINDNSWPFDFHEAIFDVVPERVVSLEACDGNNNIFRINGQELKVGTGHYSSQESCPSMNCKTIYGDLCVCWEQVQRMTRTDQFVIPEAKTCPVILETISGGMLAFEELNPTFTTFADMVVVCFNWSNVRSVTEVNNILTLHDANGFAIPLTGTALTGKTNLGDVKIPVSSVRQIKLADDSNVLPQVNSTLESYEVAKVIFKNGSIATQVRISLTKSEFDDVTIYGESTSGFFELKRNGLLYWAGLKPIIINGFKVQGSHCTVNFFGADKKFELPGQEVKVFTSIATLQGKLASITEIVPDGKTENMMLTGDPNTGVTVEYSDSTKETFKSCTIRFANYPATGWTGSYYPSQWPFQWWPADSIDIVANKTNQRMSVEISKIASIEVLLNYATRELRFKSRQGSELAGTHFYEILNEENKHGPYKWQHDREGVLLEPVDGDIFVFVPFYNIKKISFPQTDM